MQRFSPFIINALLILIMSLSASNTQAMSGRELVQSLVSNAQILFENGMKLHDQGHDDLAKQIFTESHNLLLQAESSAPSYLRRRLNSVFTQYYKRINALDSELCQELRQAKILHASFFTQEDLVQGDIKNYAATMRRNKKNFLAQGFSKAPTYLPMIQDELQRQELPLNLAYIAFIESCFNPEALSHAGARGLWQFMPKTARAYGLTVNSYIDERLDPRQSTLAALRYLKKLYAQFNDWPLALAAYNCGETRVANALRDYVATTFWELVDYEALPAETMDYVPRCIAVSVMSVEGDKF